MTIRYLIDTDWVIDHLNAIERVVTRLKELRPQGLAMSIIFLAELSEGVHDSQTPEQSHQAPHAFLEDVSVLGIDEERPHSSLGYRTPAEFKREQLERQS